MLSGYHQVMDGRELVAFNGPRDYLFSIQERLEIGLWFLCVRPSLAVIWEEVIYFWTLYFLLCDLTWEGIASFLMRIYSVKNSFAWDFFRQRHGINFPDFCDFKQICLRRDTFLRNNKKRKFRKERKRSFVENDERDKRVWVTFSHRVDSESS